MEDNLIEVITDTIKRCENFQKLCEMQMKLYKDRYSTNDINQAVNNEYWRASKIRVAYEIKDLKEILQEIEDIRLCNIKQLEEAEEDFRVLKADAQI